MDSNRHSKEIAALRGRIGAVLALREPVPKTPADKPVVEDGMIESLGRARRRARQRTERDS